MTTKEMFRVVAGVNKEGIILTLAVRGDEVMLRGKIASVVFSIRSTRKEDKPLLIVGIGCALKDDERFRPIYEAMKKIVEEEP